jgi:hypothetical protein
VNEMAKDQEHCDSDRTYEVLLEIDGEPSTVMIRAPHPEEAVRRCREQQPPQALILCVVRQ